MKSKRKLAGIGASAAMAMLIPLTVLAEDDQSQLVEAKAENAAAELKATDFKQYLPKDVEVYLHISGLEKQLKAAAEQADSEEMVDEVIGEVLDGSPGMLFYSPAPYLFQASREDAFIACVDSSGEDMVNLAKLYNTFYEQYYGALGIILLNELSPDDGDSFDFLKEFLITNLLKDDVVKLLDDLRFGSMYAGFKVSDKEEREEQLENIRAAFAVPLSLPEDAPKFEKVEVKRLGAQFTGFSLKGTNIVKSLEENGIEEMSQFLGVEATHKSINVLSKKNFVIVVGEVDEHIVFYLGDDIDNFKFEEKAADSFAANEELDFLKEYEDKEVVLTAFASKNVMQNMNKMRSIGSMSRGIKKALSNTKVINNSEIIEGLVELVIEDEDALHDIFKPERFGMVAAIDDGLKIDVLGSSTDVVYNVTEKRKFSHLKNDKDTLFFSNMIINEEYAGKYLGLLESMFFLSDSVCEEICKFDMDDHDFKEFKEYYSLFNSEFRKDGEVLWSALSEDFMKGIGNESVIYIDMKGSMPTVPNVPEEVIKEANVPRIAILRDVVDREKIGDSWDKINTSAESILKKLPKLGGPELPMQKPDYSLADGLKIYSFPIPTTHMNCKPSASVSDSLFILSTSPELSIQLAKAANKPSEAKGGEMMLNLKVASVGVQQWLDYIEEYPAILGGEANQEEYEREMKPVLDGIINLSKHYSRLDVQVSGTGKDSRTLWHLKK